MSSGQKAKDSMVPNLMSARKDTWFSFEYFPPRTEEGVKNLHKRILRMKILNPLFLDFTWGAGGSTSDLTMQLCDTVKNEFGAVANMHLTCTNMEKAKVDVALVNCKKHGICNLVALRGDPPRGQEKWEATDGGFQCALDLVKYVRANHGDYFSIAVAGYPEGHPDAIEEVEEGLAVLTETEMRRARVAKNESGVEIVTVCRDANFHKEMTYLKEKIDAGSQCVITQMFLDAEVYLDFVKICREYGITVPIIPGIMCLNGLGGLQRMTALCKSRLPDGMMDAAERSNTSDEAFKSWGIEFGAKMCQRCVEGGAPGLHFYTLNLEKVVLGVLVKMGLITAEQQAQCSAGEADAKLMISAQGITVDKLLQLQTERPVDGDVLSGSPSKRQCQTPP